jgi:hypothetical protein
MSLHCSNSLVSTRDLLTEQFQPCIKTFVAYSTSFTKRWSGCQGTEGCILSQSSCHKQFLWAKQIVAMQGHQREG